VTPRQIADRLIAKSDALLSAISLERAVTAILREGGADQFEAAVESERVYSEVGRILGRMAATSLPFELLEGSRLVGKARSRPGDSAEVTAIRSRLQLVEVMRNVVYELGHQFFEELVAALLLDAGGSLDIDTAPTNEGGIDVYGRWPVRVADPSIPGGLVNSVLVEKELFVLCQAKCYSPVTTIDRDEIDKFSAQVRACLDKYGGNPTPPARRVPSDAYVRDESALRLFVTTATYSQGARGAAIDFDISLVDGRRIAELLVYRGRGIVEVAGSPTVSADHLTSWVNGRSRPS